MEIALLLIIIIILFIRLNSINYKLKDLQFTIEDLKKTLMKLSQQKSESFNHESFVAPSKIPKEKAIEKEANTIIVSTEKVEEAKPVKEEIEDKKEPIEALQEADALNKNETENKFENSVFETIFTEEPIAAYIPQKSWWDRFRAQNPDLEKFVGENLISKIGILILVLGISYFVKFAIDKNWINETARVGIGILCGVIVMGFAHKLRINYKAFSSVLVAGAIAILYFTIGIAFHQYHIFSQTLAFILMVLITAFSVFISVSYDRMELAILSLIGGFAVPFMLSTGEGNYQVLFTYIAILDIGILAIAYKKRWSLVNVLAFAFTLLLFGAWLGTKVVGIPKAPYLGALLFATLFYFIFTLANIINNLRTNGLFSKIELSVLISNTFLYFSAGMIIFSNFHPELKGIFTTSLGLFNLVCAWIFYKKFGLDKNAIYLLIGLTLTFITLAIPLQFEGNYITLFWAAEAVLLLWLSQKSTIVQFRFASLIVHILMIGSLGLDWLQVYSLNSSITSILLNPGFIAGIVATISLFATSMLTKNETEQFSLFGIVLPSPAYRRITKFLSIIILYVTGLLEITYQSNQFYKGAYSPTSISIAYHLVFSALLIFFIQKSNSQSPKKFVIGLSIANIILYILYFANIPLGELRENLHLLSNTKIAFYLHYISLACIVYQALLVWKDGKSIDSLSIFHQKWFIWLATFAMVYVASNEVLVHGIAMLTMAKQGKHSDPHLAYSIFNTAQTFIVKVAFPILWGILAASFLTIGIKMQNRNLRIVALSLLGITIVKLFIYDISNVSETGKIVAFILLGVLILAMSFAYQKIKRIVLENEKSGAIENEEK